MEQILAEIKASGVPYVIENGTKHFKIHIAGRFVGILPRKKHSGGQRAILNVRAQVRRAIREVPNA